MGKDYDTTRSDSSGDSGGIAGKMRRLDSLGDSVSDKGEGAIERLPSMPEDAANESKSQRRARLRSLYIVHLGMFIFMLGYSIILTGVYPYMRQVRRICIKSSLCCAAVDFVTIAHGLIKAAPRVCLGMYVRRIGLTQDLSVYYSLRWDERESCKNDTH